MATITDDELNKLKYEFCKRIVDGCFVQQPTRYKAMYKFKTDTLLEKLHTEDIDAGDFLDSIINLGIDINREILNNG